MSDAIEVRVARVVDREAVLAVLEANGIAAEPLEEDGVLGFRIPCEDGESERACDDLVATLESLVADAGLPARAAARGRLRLPAPPARLADQCRRSSRWVPTFAAFDGEGVPASAHS